MTVQELRDKLATLDGNMQVVVYCRGVEEFSEGSDVVIIKDLNDDDYGYSKANYPYVNEDGKIDWCDKKNTDFDQETQPFVVIQ